MSIGEMVPGAGLEPARCCQRKILSLVCLPISPPGHRELLCRYGHLVLPKATLRVACLPHRSRTPVLRDTSASFAE